MTASGFTIEQWQEMREGQLSYEQEAVTTLAPYGGLSSNTLAHLRDDWITWLEERVEIRVPTQTTCNSFRLVSGEESGVPPLERKEDPCYYCKLTGDTDGFERLKEDFGETTTPTPRHVILHRKVAEPAVEFLEKVFKTHGRSEIGATPDGIQDAARVISEDVDTSSHHCYRKLVGTGPVIYCHYGLSLSDIAQLTPYSVPTIRRLLSETPGVSYTGEATVELLEAVNQTEPVTTAALAEKIDSSYETVRERMKRLKKEGKVSESNTDLGKPATTWSTTPEWNSLLRCEECGFETQSIQAITTHRGKKHDSGD